MSIRILATHQVPLNQPTRHAHITEVKVDTNNDGYVDGRQTKEYVIQQIKRGDSYYTYGGGRQAVVEVVRCPHACGYEIIRSTADATTINNLDSLPRY